MKLRTVSRALLVFLVTILALHPAGTPGGYPMPPHRSSPGRRQANLLMLRFQDALAADRWEEALSFCSDRVRESAGQWPSLKEFFNGTMPIESVLSQDFGCWSCGENFYGLVITLYQVDRSPFMQWYWAIASANGKWVVDYPPVKMEDYIARRKAAIQERADRVAAIQRELEPQTRQVSAQISTLTNRFSVGEPMPFRLEFKNEGTTEVRFKDGGAQHYGLKVTDANHAAVPYGDPPAQVADGGAKVLAGHESVVVADRIDINRYQAIKKPGKYFVTWNTLRIGKRIPMEEMGRFGENLSVATYSDFFAATNVIASNVIEIEVGP